VVLLLNHPKIGDIYGKLVVILCEDERNLKGKRVNQWRNSSEYRTIKDIMEGNGTGIESSV